jgi:hypothetical protein
MLITLYKPKEKPTEVGNQLYSSTIAFHKSMLSLTVVACALSLYKFFCVSRDLVYGT